MKSINMPLAVTKDARVVGHLKKGKTGRYAKTAFYFLWTNPLNTANITLTGEKLNFGHGQSLQIACTISSKGEGKYTEILKKKLNLYPL